MSFRSFLNICLALALLSTPAKVLSVSLIHTSTQLYACEDGAVVNTIPIGGCVLYADLSDCIVTMGRMNDQDSGLPLYFISKETGRIVRKRFVPLPPKVYPLSTVFPSEGLYVSKNRKILYFIAQDEANGRFRLAKYVFGSESAEMIDIPEDMGAPQLTFLNDETLLVYGNGGGIKYNLIDSSLTRVIRSGFLEEFERANAKGSDDFSAGWMAVPGVGFFIVERFPEGLRLRRLVEGIKIDKKLSVLVERRGKEVRKSKIRVTAGDRSQVVAVIGYEEKIGLST